LLNAGNQFFFNLKNHFSAPSSLPPEAATQIAVPHTHALACGRNNWKILLVKHHASPYIRAHGLADRRTAVILQDAANFLLFATSSSPALQSILLAWFNYSPKPNVEVRK
jgi:hypothetical protein